MCFSKLKSIISITFLLSLFGIITSQCTVDAKTNYLTFTAETDSSSFGIVNYNENNPDIQYSLDGGKRWIKLSHGTPVVLKEKGDRALLKGINPEGFSKNEEYTYTNFVMGGRIKASGSVMSLIDGCGESKEIKGKKCFFNLFANCVSLTQAPELPATTLTEYCYSGMFSFCTELTKAPQLPATSLTKACYFRMFQSCNNLRKAPELPATSLAKSCYFMMFEGCNNLKEAPKLPATILAESCYCKMFYTCGNLVQAPQLPATTLAKGCYEEMFVGCYNLKKAPQLPATTLAESCYCGMFYYCSNLEEAPQLPATTLAKGCYRGMFKNCTNLTKAPELPATSLTSICYDEMFSECQRLETIKVGFTRWDAEDTASDETENKFEYLDPDLPEPENQPICDMPIVVDPNRLNNIKKKNGWYTLNWLSEVAPNGTFICPKELPQEFGKDRIPNGWKVVNE